MSCFDSYLELWPFCSQSCVCTPRKASEQLSRTGRHFTLDLAIYSTCTHRYHAILILAEGYGPMRCELQRKGDVISSAGSAARPARALPFLWPTTRCTLRASLNIKELSTTALLELCAPRHCCDHGVFQLRGDAGAVGIQDG